MADFFELASAYERTENIPLNTFTSALKRQIEAVNSGNLTSRSWAKEDGSGFTVKLGKLDKSYDIPDRGKVLEFLHSALNAAQSNAEFQKMVEDAYAVPVEEPVKGKRGRKPKAA
ncbi:hypothetical protein [Neorhizobium alkalisoli]|uniref:Uncharacterized protein n=1 Tax=Neorhizobium alkalisoli TaxID=528178 RepID=A0A561Q7J3_9HYPH|nr:hypothetical protein [Neorhizobium alkalisoli]TWF46307.1 hypothetical protein FHW37_1152 [Neorhizobium alkalisoli]